MCLFLIHRRILKKEGKNTVSHFLVHCGEARTKLYGPSSEALFATAKLGPNFLVRSSEATFIAARLSPSPQRRALRCCEVCLCRNEGTLLRGEATRIPTPINTHGCPFFSLHPFFVRPFVSCSCLVCVFLQISSRPRLLGLSRILC